MIEQSYPIDFSEERRRIQNGEYGPFDADGVPQVDYRHWYGAHGIRGSLQKFPVAYTPVTIAQYALSLWQQVLTGDDEPRRQFLAQCDWLVKNLQQGRGDFWVWRHEFPMPVYRLQPGWVSAMAQGEGISVLLRAYHATGEPTYLSAAQRALRAFLFELNDGGVTCTDADGNLWFEEYPHQPPAHVLNGMIFAMLGLDDLLQLNGDADAQRLFRSGVLTLKQHLPEYDAGYGSLYDLYHRQVVGDKYQRLHIQQLSVLAQLTGESVFADYARHWQKQDRSKWQRWQRRWRPKLTVNYWRLKLRLWQI